MEIMSALCHDMREEILNHVEAHWIDVGRKQWLANIRFVNQEFELEKSNLFKDVAWLRSHSGRHYYIQFVAGPMYLDLLRVICTDQLDGLVSDHYGINCVGDALICYLTYECSYNIDRPCW